MCYKCGKKLDVALPISRSEECPNCGSDVRCCKNCIHYSVGVHYDCKEHVDELVVEKERANFCDWFSLKQCSAETSMSTKEVNAKAQFNSLFGD